MIRAVTHLDVGDDDISRAVGQIPVALGAGARVLTLLEEIAGPLALLGRHQAPALPVPLDPLLARTLCIWRAHTKYKAAIDWVFASPYSGG